MQLSTSPKKEEGGKNSKFGKKNLSEVMFGHDNSHLGQVNLEDDAFADWYRKTAGMHTVEVRTALFLGERVKDRGGVRSEVMKQ